MVNLKQELENYPPIDLQGLMESSLEMPDNIKNSIILYNKALESIKLGSEDMAIIELKKSVSMNPDFHEAMNLLGICYSYINENSKASEMFEKVVAAEQNSIRALKYMEMLGVENVSSVSSKPKKQQKNEIHKKEKAEKVKPENKLSGESFKKSLKQDLLKYVIGAAVGALIIFLIGLGGTNSGNLALDEPDTADTGSKEIFTVSDEQYKELSEKYEAVSKEAKELREQNDYYILTMKLFDIDKMISKKQYEEAAETLLLLNTVEFTGPEREKLDAMLKSVMPEAASMVYTKGKALYDSGDYQEAIEKLKKVQVYDANSDRSDDAYYYTARSYTKLNDSRNALPLFKKVVEDYPGSGYVKYAVDWINSLQNVP